GLVLVGGVGISGCKWNAATAPRSPQPPFAVHDADGVAPVWRLRRSSSAKAVIVALTPRLMSDDMIGLKQAAIAGLGLIALPGYVCRDEVRSGALRRVLPAWLAGGSTTTALVPYREGLLPSVRVFICHLALAVPTPVLLCI